MDRRALLRRAGTIATAGAVALSGCSGESEDRTESGTTTATAGGANTVGMVTYRGDYYFDPIGLFVEPGTTVTWELESGDHSATSYTEGTGGASVRRIPDGASGWNSETLSSVGATFEYTFETPGTYDYFCLPHKSLEMVGRVVVGQPGGPADGSMPPDGDVPTGRRIVDEGRVSYDAFGDEV